MTTLVTDAGFAPPPDAPATPPLAALGPGDAGVTLGPADDPAALTGMLDRLALVRVAFPSFADGRGFTIARQLRLAGYRGALHASGPLIADQYAMARRSGFDAVEIPDALAARQPEGQWRFRADWRAHDYRSRLLGDVTGSAPRDPGVRTG